MKKIYLAGPDVFRSDAQDYGDYLKGICLKYGLEGYYPLDNEINLEGLDGPQKGLTIYNANVDLIDSCDAIIANLTPFRGISADVGTVFELGYAIAQGKPVSIYSTKQSEYKSRINYSSSSETVEDFGLVDNLMLLGPTNNVILKSVEDAIKSIAYKVLDDKTILAEYKEKKR